jgi:predicted dehydrogenase
MIQAGSALRGGEHQDARGPRIYGARGQMILDSKPSIYLQEPWEGMSLGDWGRVPFSGPTADREQIVSRFATAVLAGEPPPCTGEDGRAALEIVLAAYRSGELGRPTELPLQS